MLKQTLKNNTASEWWLEPTVNHLNECGEELEEIKEYLEGKIITPVSSEYLDNIQYSLERLDELPMFLNIDNLDDNEFTSISDIQEMLKSFGDELTSVGVNIKELEKDCDPILDALNNVATVLYERLDDMSNALDSCSEEIDEFFAELEEA